MSVPRYNRGEVSQESRVVLCHEAFKLLVLLSDLREGKYKIISEFVLDVSSLTREEQRMT
jgi:hypothetical protein